MKFKVMCQVSENLLSRAHWDDGKSENRREVAQQKSSIEELTSHWTFLVREAPKVSWSIRERI